MGTQRTGVGNGRGWCIEFKRRGRKKEFQGEGLEKVGSNTLKRRKGGAAIPQVRVRD